jgi:hypothetical protein
MGLHGARTLFGLQLPRARVSSVENLILADEYKGLIWVPLSFPSVPPFSFCLCGFVLMKADLKQYYNKDVFFIRSATVHF